MRGGRGVAVSGLEEEKRKEWRKSGKEEHARRRESTGGIKW